MTKAELIRSVARLDHVASVQHSVLTAGTAAGTRVIDVRMWDGLDVQLLPDRGFDIGPAWYHGVPVAWESSLGYRPALSTPLDGMDWITAFGGGLVTTCGLFNVGAPSEGQGMHGNISHSPADDVTVTREVDDSGEVAVHATATLREGSALGPMLELKRRWTFHTGEGLAELVDTVTNRGHEQTPAPILYHINFGAPFWSSDAWIDGPGGDVIPRDTESAVGLPTWDQAPTLASHAPEWSFEHLLPADGKRWQMITINSPRLGIRCAVEWDTSTLPRLHQWVHPATGINALGIEPSNCSVRGRGADRAEGRLPSIDPDESRTSQLRVRFSAYA